MTNGCKILGLAPSFGFGDRLGLATPGHVAAMVEAGAGIEPIFPQQSIREMARTARTPQQVMDDALGGMKTAGWDGGTGADADHLKTFKDVDVTAAVGFTFYTIDPSDYVDDQADDYDEATLRERFAAVRDEVAWIDEYRDKSFSLATGGIVDLDEGACMKAAVKYGLAVNHAIAMANHIRTVNEESGHEFEIELSVDETEQPTTLAEHFIVAEACLSAGMELVSLAPRFIGDLEKGVDYKGDLHALQRSLDDHAAIAELIGPYKLSLHSGSDKLSMYAALARSTEGQFHVKTAGTSYLEALRVVARHDEALFRRIVDFSRSRYDEDRRTYHVSARLEDVAPPSEIDNVSDLEREYVECWSDVPEGKGFTKPGRQILHCTFGSVLTDTELGPLVRDLLETHIDTYTEVLVEHFVRHLRALQQGMP
jgi:hypothetical protein